MVETICIFGFEAKLIAIDTAKQSIEIVFRSTKKT